MPLPVVCSRVDLFPTRLGWMVLVGREADASAPLLDQLSFGHSDEATALAVARSLAGPTAEFGDFDAGLRERLQAYAEGAVDDFADVKVNLTPFTPFAQRVLRHCRRVPYGETLSYRELATRAGAPLAARAVGSVMAKNRCPLIVPCHRIVATGTGLGGYSAPGGLKVKRRLLDMEAAGAMVTSH